jgi:hypothetical protein
MNEIRAKLRRLSYKLKHNLSIENIVLIVAVIMCLTWTYQSIAAMSRNWTLTDRLATVNRERTILELEVETMELENSYYASDEYQELLARKHANKQLPGEHLVSLPDNSETAKTKHATTTTTTKPTEYSNFDKWIRFLFP